MCRAVSVAKCASATVITAKGELILLSIDSDISE